MRNPSGICDGSLSRLVSKDFPVRRGTKGTCMGRKDLETGRSRLGLFAVPGSGKV